MKKFYAFISVLLILTAAAFADVSVKKLDNGQIEVTFFYPNPRAQEVVVAGDFTDWQNGAQAMTKSDKGWTYVRTVAPGTVMKYKFISDGNWTEDMHEPDKVDDGFGGHNGLVDVDALVAASSGKTDGASAETAAATEKKGALKFATWSMLGYQAKWGDGTKGNKNELQSSGINLKSYLKVSGDALPGFPIYIEVALAEQDGFNNLYNKGTTEWSNGWKNLLVDTIFDPIYYYGGQSAAKTYLGHLKLGLDTPYVNYVTGYKYAKLPPHTNVNWNTIDKEWEAGYNSVGGYSQFEFAPLFNKILADTGVTADVVLAPNRTADRAGSQYGFYGYANAKFNTGNFGHYVDFQYNGAYGTTYDKIFDSIMEDDFILGYQGNYGPVTVKANGLYNMYGSTNNGDGTKTPYSPSTSDVGMVDDADKSFADNSATNINVAFGSDMINIMAGYRTRGIQASMMYVEQGADDHTDIADQLGYRNTQVVFGDISGTFAKKALTVGVKPKLTMVLNKDKDYYYDGSVKFNSSKTMYVNVRPYFNVDLKPLADFDGKTDGYVSMNYLTKDTDKYVRGTNKSQFHFAEAGLKYTQKVDSDIVKEVTAVYAFDDTSSEYVYNTLTADIVFPFDITGQIGCGIRTAEPGNEQSSIVSPFGFYVGAKKKLTVMYKPTAYIQFMSGMDPYNAFGDGPTAYKLNSGSYTLYRDQSGHSDYNGVMAVRCGFQWDL